MNFRHLELPALTMSAASTAPPALAQSSITLYGIIDSAVQYANTGGHIVVRQDSSSVAPDGLTLRALYARGTNGASGAPPPLGDTASAGLNFNTASGFSADANYLQQRFAPTAILSRPPAFRPGASMPASPKFAITARLRSRLAMPVDPAYRSPPAKTSRAASPASFTCFSRLHWSTHA